MRLAKNSWPYKTLKFAGWGYIAMAILMLLVFTGIRFVDLIESSSSPDAYEIRYIQHPWTGMLHLVPGLIFVVLAPLQFIGRIRSRHLGFHRVSGRLLLICGLFSGVMGIYSAFSLPAFGGVGAQTASVLFGTIFIVSLIKAFQHVRLKQIAMHREWVIRAFALASSVATIRIVIGLQQAFGSSDLERVFAIGFWLGFAINLLVAEAWIKLTRPAKNSNQTH